MSKFSKNFFKVVFLAIALVVLILLFSLNDNLDWFSRFTLCKMLSFSIAAATFFSAYHPKLIQAPHSGFFFSGVAFNYCALFTVEENEFIVDVMAVLYYSFCQPFTLLGIYSNTENRCNNYM